MRDRTKRWISAAAIRAVRTFAQTACGLMTVGAAINEIEWVYVFSVSAAAAIFSVLTSLAGLPEVDTEPPEDLADPEEPETEEDPEDGETPEG